MQYQMLPLISINVPDSSIVINASLKYISSWKGFHENQLKDQFVWCDLHIW